MHNTERVVLLNMYEILENSAPALMFHQLQLNASVQMDRAQMATSSVEFSLLWTICCSEVKRMQSLL